MELLGKGNIWQGRLAPLPFKTWPDSLAALEVEGYVMFSLGPLYVYAGVQESLPEIFAGDECTQKALKDKPVVSGICEFQHQILGRCEKWNNVLDVMPRDTFDFFSSWMLTQVFINRVEKTVFVPRRMSAAVLDPLAYAKGKKIPTSLILYSVSGMHSIVRPRGHMSHDQAKSYIDLERGPPEPHVITMGRAMLDLSEKA